MPRQKSDNPLANHEIVTLAVYLLGGGNKPIDTEDVAVKANELAPGRFTWRKHNDQISLDAVRKRLWDAKSGEKEFQFLTGLEREGWMLTEAGGEFCSRNLQRLEKNDLSRKRLSESERKWLNRERSRIISTSAYEKVTGGREQEVTRQEAENFFRVDEYVTGEARDRKIARLVNAFRGDEQVGPVVEAVRTKV